jgi:hypothetical protein
MGQGGVSERKRREGAGTHRRQRRPHDLRTASRDNKKDGDVVLYVPVEGSAVGAVPARPAVEFREVGAGAVWDRQNSTTTTLLALPSSWGGSPSRRRRSRGHAPVFLRPVPAIEAVVAKRRAGSISTLGAAAAAFSTGIVVVLVVVISPVVVVERERRRCGRMRGGQLEVVENGKRRT